LQSVAISPGTGKSHLLMALGTAAAMAGFRVRYGRVDLLCIDLCRHCDYAESKLWGLVTEDGWLAVARHSYRASRKASVLSVGW
jgi:hypothetical protein